MLINDTLTTRPISMPTVYTICHIWLFLSLLSIHGIIGAQPMIANTKYIQFCAIYAHTALSIIPFAPMPNIALMYKKAFPIPVERKITHPMMTSTMVYMCPHQYSFLPSPVNFSNVSITKYISPHAINVQFAPCQMPVSSHTTNKLKTTKSKVNS